MAFRSESLIYAEMSEWCKEHDWKSCVGLKPTGGSNPLLCASFQAGFYPSFFMLFFAVFTYTTILEFRKKRELCRFLSLKLVHDMHINVHNHIARGVPDKLLTHRRIDAAFATPCYKRMPKLVQVMTAA